VSLQGSLWRIRVSQVPQQDGGRHVVGSGCKKLGGVVRIPRDGTDGFPVVVQGQRGFLGLQVPYCDEPSRTAGRQDVRNLAIPCHTLKIIGPSGSGAEPEGVGYVIDVVDEQLPFRTSRCQDMWLERIELQRPDGAGVLRGAG
jgi:hypothetical protein